MITITGRSRAALCTVSLALVGTSVLGAGPGPQRESRERHVIAAVTDRNDKPVPGLTGRDFIIREDDATREVTGAAPADPPSHLVLLIDDSQTTETLTIELRAGIKSFLRQVMRSAEGVDARAPDTAREIPRRTAIRLATFGARPTVVAEFTTSLASLVPAVDRIVPRPGAGGVLLEAIFESCRDLKKQAAVRPVIVAFVDEHSPEFSNDTRTRIADALKEIQASLWTIVLQNPGGDDTSQPVRERTRVLAEVTVQSGGWNTMFLSRQGIEPAFVAVATKLTNRYDVTFARPATQTPPSRLDVQMRDRALRVAAPRWAAP